LRISVIGCGYVGLVTAACLAEAGHEVMCTDIDAARIAQLNAGGVPILRRASRRSAGFRQKSGADFLYERCGRSDSIRRRDIYLRGNASAGKTAAADLSAIDHGRATDCGGGAEFQIDRGEEHGPCANRARAQPGAGGLFTRAGSKRFAVVSNPEFLREGTAVFDFFPSRPHRGGAWTTKPRRRPCGAFTSRSLERKFRCPIHQDGCPAEPKAEFLVTTINSAELIKHAFEFVFWR